MSGLSPITVEAEITSPIEEVWKKWTTPSHIVNWNFASDDWCCPRSENDLCPGGKFNWRMEARDGSMGFDFEGVFTNVVENSLIEYEMADGRKVSITFSETGGGTLVTEIFDPEEMNPPELQKQGWQAILNNFKKYAEAT